MEKIKSTFSCKKAREEANFNLSFYFIFLNRTRGDTNFNFFYYFSLSKGT